MKSRSLIVCMLSLLLFGCAEKKMISVSKEIRVNVDSCVELHLDHGKIVALETIDASLLYDIISVEEIENKYFIYSRGSVLSFDANGKYLYHISRRGQGDKEYLNLTSFFIKNSELCLYDFGTRRILIFDSRGKYLRTEKILTKDIPGYIPYLICPIGENKYLAKNQFNGTPGAITPALSLIDNKAVVTQKVEGRSLTSGFTLFDFVCFNHKNGAITYWEALNDTIYTIENNVIRAKYIVNFGKYSIPQTARIHKDVYDLIAFVNKPENKEYATFVRYVYEEVKYVYFVFLCGKSTYLAKYNKQTQKTTIYTLPYGDNRQYRLAPFLKVEKDNLILVLENVQEEESNQALFVINKNKLL